MLIECLSRFGRFIFAFAQVLLFESCSESFGGPALCKSRIGSLVALRLCIQSRSKGFGGSASAHTNQAVDFW
jgi:hypothetical protein